MQNKSWLLEYAPKSFRKEHLILPDEVRDQFIEIIEGRWKENILLSGTPGTGKSSVAQLLLKHAVEPIIIDLPQYKSDKHWQEGGQGWRKMMGTQLSQFFLEPHELRKKKIKRLVVLEEFDVLNSQHLFKTLLNARDDTICVLTTNHIIKITEPIKSRCVHFSFGRDSELWINREHETPAGYRDQIEKDVRYLIRAMLKKELKRSVWEKKITDGSGVVRDYIETEEVANFFRNVINTHYPSVRDILGNVRKYVIKKQLKIPPRLMR
jgi:DNA polymerase III delta prime subunit